MVIRIASWHLKAARYRCCFRYIVFEQGGESSPCININFFFLFPFSFLPTIPIVNHAFPAPRNFLKSNFIPFGRSKFFRIYLFSLLSFIETHSLSLVRYFDSIIFSISILYTVSLYYTQLVLKLKNWGKNNRNSIKKFHCPFFFIDINGNRPL